MIGSPFLTAVDEARLNIRGSRDPLGLVPLWGKLGRRVVGNLTTATTSVRSFTAMLLGYYFAEEFVPAGRDAEALRLGAFLKFEQLTGYARWHVNGDGNLRGINEVRRRLAEQDTIRIAADSSGQILSNQKTYGLWGLYTMPSRASGLIAQDALCLTPLAREFVESHVLRVLRKAKPDAEKRIGEILRREHTDIEPDGKDSGLLSALAKALAPAVSDADREFYRSYLVLGKAGSCEWQETFATMVEEHLPAADDFCLKHLGELIKQARRRGNSQLAEHLQSIRELEALLVPLADLFGYLQSRDGAKVSAVTGELRDTWGKGLTHVEPKAITELSGAIGEVYGDALAATRFADLASAFRAGDFHSAVSLCLAHNEFVMRSRGGASPWVIVSDGRLDVRFRDEGLDGLSPAKTLAAVWRNGFYLDPLKLIADELRAA